MKGTKQSFEYKQLKTRKKLIWKAIKERDLTILNELKETIEKLSVQTQLHILRYSILDQQPAVTAKIFEYCNRTLPRNLRHNKDTILKKIQECNLGELTLYITAELPEISAAIFDGIIEVCQGRLLHLSEKATIRYFDQLLAIPNKLKAKVNITQNDIELKYHNCLYNAVIHNKPSVMLAISAHVPDGYFIALEKALAHQKSECVSKLLQHIDRLFSSTKFSNEVRIAQVLKLMIRQEDKEEFLGQVMLHLARKNDHPMLEHSISLGADPAYDYASLILILIDKNHLERARIFLEAHKDKFAVHNQIIAKWTFDHFIHAPADSETQNLLLALYQFIKTTWPDNDFYKTIQSHAFIECVYKNDYLLAEMLIERKLALPCAISLEQAVLHADLKMVQLLCKNGASCHVNNFFTLELAVRKNKLDIVTFFFEEESTKVFASIDIIDIALENGNMPMLTLLLQKFVIHSPEFITIMKQAIEAGSLEGLQTVLLYAESRHHNNKVLWLELLQLAAVLGHSKIVDFIIPKLQGQLTQDDVRRLLVYASISGQVATAEKIASLDSYTARIFDTIKDTKLYQHAELLFTFLSFEFGQDVMKRNEQSAALCAIRTSSVQNLPFLIKRVNSQYNILSAVNCLKQLVKRNDPSLIKNLVPTHVLKHTNISLQATGECYQIASEKMKIELLKCLSIPTYSLSSHDTAHEVALQLGHYHHVKILDLRYSLNQQHPIKMMAEKFDGLCSEYLARNERETNALRSLLCIGTPMTILSLGWKLPIEIGTLVLETCFKATSFKVPHKLTGIRYLSEECMEYISNQLIEARSKFYNLPELLEKAKVQQKAV